MRGAIASPAGSPSAARARRWTLALAALCASLLVLALSASPAFAYVGRPYVSQITGFSNPFGVAVDSSDNLWVTDTGNGVVDKYDPSGNLLNVGTGPPGGFPFGGGYIQSAAWSNAANKLFVADSGNDDLWVLNPDASYFSDITSFPDGGGGCCFLFTAADNSGTATDGDLYISDGSTVTRIDSAGNAVNFTAGSNAGTNVLTGADAPGGFGYTQGVAVDPAGNLYVADTGNNVVDVFNPDGSYKTQLTGADTIYGHFYSVSSVAIDPTNGDILVPDRIPNQGTAIQEFDSSGNFKFAFDGSDAPNSFNSVPSLAFDSHGNLYLSIPFFRGGGVVDVFKPAPPPIALPTIDATSSSDLTQSSATLNAQINPGLGDTVYRFRYGTDASYGSSTLLSDSIGSDNTDHAVSAGIGGLAPATTYHYQAVAVNLTGTTHGPDRTFTTPATPLVSSSSASAITQTTATLGASINPRLSSTTYHFEYGTSSSYGQSTPESASLGSDSSAHPASADLSGLAAGTVYHYRVVATNGVGATDGPDQTFTTTAPPPPPPPPPPPLVCKQGFVKKHGACVKKPHHKRHHKRSARHG